MEENKEFVLGIDYGDKRTGLAFGRSGLVKPLKIVETGDLYTLISEINKVIIQNKINKVIVGLPLDESGKDTPQSLKVRKFIKSLKTRIKTPIELISEHSTTQESIRGAIKSGISRKRRGNNDDLSAALIVKRYFSNKEYEDTT